MYLPSAAIGNSLTLATFGPSGELMGFFYPHIDFAQNVREGMFAVALPREGEFDLRWCFDERWKREQSMEDRSNVLRTTLLCRAPSLRIEVTDAAIPGAFAVLRRIRVQRDSPQPGVRFYQYFNLSLRDVDRRNAVHHWPDDNVVVQQFRRVAIGVTASRPYAVQCGGVGPGGSSEVKRGMAEGRLSGGGQAMGDVDFAVGFELPAEREWIADLVIVGGTDRHDAGKVANRLISIPAETHLSAARERCESFLAQTDGHGGPPHSGGPSHSSSLPASLAAPCTRAALSIMDLYDERSGTFIAAPEFDPYYTRSGGYGYCWPRDAAHTVGVLSELGFHELADRFFAWCRSAQLPDGHWYQRYWVDGTEAPSWCVRPEEIQLDQTCALVHAAGLHARRLGAMATGTEARPTGDGEGRPTGDGEGRPTEDGEGRPTGDGEGRSTENGEARSTENAGEFLDAMRACIERATRAIIRHIDDTGLHKQAADLWECCYGSFAYTGAGVIAALGEAEAMFGLPVPDRARLRRRLIETFHRPQTGAWLRRIDEKGKPDETADSSVLGLIEPWGLLDLTDADDRTMALGVIRFVEERLAVSHGEGRAILRFEHETYMGGGAGCVNTLWLAQVMLRVAAHCSDPERSELIDQAKSYVHTALAMANPVGQLPELSPKVPGIPYWAAPHGWASALLIQCARLM